MGSRNKVVVDNSRKSIPVWLPLTLLLEDINDSNRKNILYEFIIMAKGTKELLEPKRDQNVLRMSI